MGSAVNAADLTRELARYRAAGMGGVHIIPIYGAKGYEGQYLEYLSPPWMAMLKHVVSEGARLDLFVDMTLGTGWCFGGPNVTPQEACAAQPPHLFASCRCILAAIVRSPSCTSAGGFSTRRQVARSDREAWP